MRAALDDPQLRPERISIIYPGTARYHLNDKVAVVPLSDLLGATTIADLG